MRVSSSTTVRTLREQTVTIVIPQPHGGVADFARLLSEAIRPIVSTASVLVLSSSLRVAPPPHVAGHTYFIQFSAYGYQRRGLPFWLIEWARLQRDNGANIACYFHEIYAWGPPWTSAFWLSPAQRSISRRLAKLSDFWLTNRNASARWLAGATPDTSALVLPVFSNVGEDANFQPKRDSIAIVFGSPALRLQVYDRGGDKLLSWARSKNIEIHDVGPPLTNELMRGQLAKAGVRFHGWIPRDQVHLLLGRARVGLLSYPAAYLAKSGVLAAYCSHGVCPVVFSQGPMSSDGLTPNLNYLASLPANAHPIEQIARCAWDWYQPHRLAAHVARFTAHLSIAKAT
jgi:hypothetical protein